MITANAHMKSRMEPKAGRGGRALLAGLFRRCRRCGRMLNVGYAGRDRLGRYRCRGAQWSRGEDWCISFGGIGDRTKRSPRKCSKPSAATRSRRR